MRIHVDLSLLHNAVEQMGASSVNFDDLIFEEAGELNVGITISGVLDKDISLSEITHENGVLNYKGHQVMLYIPDQGDDIDTVLVDGSQGRRIHIAECSTIDLMRDTGRFPRYEVTNNTDGDYAVYGTSEQSGEHLEGSADLKVCKNCLSKLNYQGYGGFSGYQKKEIFNRFNFEEFFKTYSSYFSSLPPKKSTAVDKYTPDWPTISSRLKSENNHTCEQCGINLSDYKNLLHVHHVDGVKSNNSIKNLRVVCADCHKKQPNHEHLYIKPDDVVTINRLRREQHKLDTANYSQAISYADTALMGLLMKCKQTSLPAPELGLIALHNEVNIPLDLSWPRKKVAVIINSANAPVLKSKGWNVFSAQEALNNFSKFQKYTR
ncbi:HNH endonuclease signature motif containing protein [Thalassotalea ponticola]|uniref:HNH endonuclease n=1 Tax=Thalassotalea ponticola TaxID=1523392 RepID=UPI0025B3096B|nr:HNH endonuclease signature motif containing protein [Thalassotalea ponticola]MDN3652311.1 HNH endonuclease signature motif containing protein [Thalassotalea ponticola]